MVKKPVPEDGKLLGNQDLIALVSFIRSSSKIATIDKCNSIDDTQHSQVKSDQDIDISQSVSEEALLERISEEASRKASLDEMTPIQ